jgi:hypothetical protein
VLVDDLHDADVIVEDKDRVVRRRHPEQALGRSEHVDQCGAERARDGGPLAGQQGLAGRGDPRRRDAQPPAYRSFESRASMLA